MSTICCPICQQETLLSADNPFRPFCGLRCQNRDLGAWAAEQYNVPDTETPLSFEAKKDYTNLDKE